MTHGIVKSTHPFLISVTARCSSGGSLRAVPSTLKHPQLVTDFVHSHRTQQVLLRVMGVGESSGLLTNTILFYNTNMKYYGVKKSSNVDLLFPLQSSYKHAFSFLFYHTKRRQYSFIAPTPALFETSVFFYTKRIHHCFHHMTPLPHNPPST